MFGLLSRGGFAAAKHGSKGKISDSRDATFSTMQNVSHCWANVLHADQVDDQPVRSSSRRLEELELKFREMLQEEEATFATPATKLEKLTMVMGGVIVANTIFTALELDYAIKSEDVVSEERFPWFVCESIFATLYIAELCIRIYLERRKWLYSGWNWFDLILIASAVLDTWLMPFLQTNAQGLQSLALLRLVRLIRLTRLLKLLRYFKKLYQIVISYIGALYEMVWILLLLMIGLFMSSLLVTSFIGKSSDFADVPIAGRTAYEQFGTVPRSMYSLFVMMTLEGWDEVARPIVEKKPFFFLFFFAFIMLFTFGLLNMIIAIVVEKSMNTAKVSEEEARAKFHLKLLKVCLKVCRWFHESDSDRNGIMNRSEFLKSIDKDVFSDILEEVGLNTADLSAIFDILDANGSGSVTPEEFLESILKVQGVLPSTWDMIEMHSKVNYLAKQFSNGRPFPEQPTTQPLVREISPPDNQALNQVGFNMTDVGGSKLPRKLKPCLPASDEMQAASEATWEKFASMAAQLETLSTGHINVLQRLDSSQAAQQTILDKLEALSVNVQSMSARLESQSAAQAKLLQRLDLLERC